MHQLGPACAHRHSQAARSCGRVLGGFGRVTALGCRIAASRAPLLTVSRAMPHVYPCRAARLSRASVRARAARPARLRLAPARPTQRPVPCPAPTPCHGLAVLYCDIVRPCLTIQLAQLPNSLVTIPLGVLRYKSLLPAFSHNTVQCIAIHSSVLLGALVTIQSMYCNTLPAHPSCLSCNTISIIAIQLGSSPNQVLHQKYFSFFTFFFILHLFQPLKKY